MLSRFVNEYWSAKIGTADSLCDPKSVNVSRRNDSGVAVETDTYMSAKTVKGNLVEKVISIDDESGETSEIIDIHDGHKTLRFFDAGLTRYRCGAMTALAIRLMNVGEVHKVGFIGTGRTNLANCIAIQKAFGVEDIVVRGSPRNYAKNVGDFMSVCRNVSVDTSDTMQLLNECDVVVTCVSTCDKAESIGADKLWGPKLIVALDCGYYLDESFRYCRPSYTDYTDQIKAHYHEEFPYDQREHDFIQLDHHRGKCLLGVVYLYGVATADAVAAEELSERLKQDGMENAFLA